MPRFALALLAAGLLAGPAAADVIIVINPNDGPPTDYSAGPPVVNPLDTFFAPQGVTLSTVGGGTSSVYGVQRFGGDPERAFAYNYDPMVPDTSGYWAGGGSLLLRADLAFLASVAVVAFSYDDTGGAVGPPVLTAYGDGGVLLGATMTEIEIDGVRLLRFDAGSNLIRSVTAAYTAGANPGFSDEAAFLAFGFGIRSSAAVPEPATLAALGLLAVGGFAARRRVGRA